MAYTIADAKSDLQGQLRGTSVNKITNIESLFWRAARAVLADVDPQETIRKTQIASAIFEQVYDYTCPADLKGDKVIDLAPQTGRTPADRFSQVYDKEFDLYKESGDNLVDIVFNNGVKSLRIKKDLTGLINVNQVNGVTTNGTWVGSDDATNLTTDTQTYVVGSASVNFDVNGSTTTATLTNTGMTAVDLSNHDEQSTIFVWFYFPNASAITSVAFDWGNDSSNYWSATATAAFQGAFQNGFNLLAFDWNGATETGTVAPAAIDFLRATITYDGTADTDLRIDGVVSNLGKIFDIRYYSQYLFSNSSGTWIEKPTDDTDTINLSTESYDLFINKCAELASQQIEQLKDDTRWFQAEYMKSLRRYKSSTKSQAMKRQGSYYRMR